MSDSIRSNPAALAFTSIAQRYCMLLEHPIRDRELWLADVLTALAALYAAAPVLLEVAAPVSVEKPQNIPLNFKLSNEEWNLLYLHLKAALGPLAVYSAHFNPVAAATDQPSQGDLADDLADIYRDIKPGLTAWNSGDDSYLADTLFQWLEFGYPHHWGRHATSALRVLHFLVHK